MRMFGSWLGVLVVSLLLSACEPVEQKAERKYQNPVELAEAGESERARVELRGVFDLDGTHRDARMLYARLLEDEGSVQDAYSHYLLVAEQYPEDAEAHVALARLAANTGAWEAAAEHVTRARSAEAEQSDVLPLETAVAYSEAVQGSDEEARARAVERARSLLAERPEQKLLRQVVVDDLLREGDLSAAMAEVDAALESAPDDLQLHQLRLNLLARLEDMDGLGAQLRRMVELQPEDPEIRGALVRWYLANGNADGAEQFLRDLIARSGEDAEPRLTLVQFLNQVRGTDAALAELDRLIEEGTSPATFRLLKASLLYDDGERETAIEQVEALIAEQTAADAPADDLREMKTTLARMLFAEGRKDRGRALVEEVLAEDSSYVDALKLRATWLIEEDRVREAVLGLRTALDQAPGDAETMTLLARAYERGGNRELMAESLSRAVELSNAAPAESLRYARYLLAEEKYLSAEDILLQALRLAPRDVGLLRALAQTYLGMDDTARAEQVVERLRGVGTPEAETLAKGLESAVLQRMARTDESLALMRSMIDEGQSSLAAQTEIIRTHLANGEVARARVFMDEMLAETPEDSPDRIGVDFLNAALTATEGDFAAARRTYREILSDNPEIEAVWRALVATAIRQGAVDDANAIVDEALAELPQSSNLKWIKAGLLERAGRIDEAVGIYEELYESDSNSTVIANNLASLLTTYRDDDESLQRAYRIARRLRGTDVPAFQDTYGWIAFRMGNQAEAIEYLEPAAAALPGDPTVQYHLARAYMEADRFDDARPHLERAVELWQGSELQLAERARADLAALDAAPAAEVEAEQTVGE